MPSFVVAAILVMECGCRVGGGPLAFGSDLGVVGAGSLGHCFAARSFCLWHRLGFRVCLWEHAGNSPVTELL